MKRKVQNKTEGLVESCSIPAVGGSFPSREWLMDVIDEAVDNNQTLDSENIADSIIEQWEKENESIKKLEVGKDYISEDGNLVVIDRLGSFRNRGFDGKNFDCDFFCSNSNEWREATEEEVIGAFEKHLPHRFGEDWRTMKIKERHPDSFIGLPINGNSCGVDTRPINDNLYGVEIVKAYDGWNVYNENGLLYCNGIWVERLEEEEPKIHIKDAIKENTVIHCETEEESERILGMAHELGYKWCSGEGYKNNTIWRDYKEKTCYRLIDGTLSNYDYFKKSNYTIIPSTQIAELKTDKLTDWTTPPKDFEYKKIKISSNVDKKRYKVIKATFSDCIQFSIGDNKNNSVIAHFVNQDEDTLLLAEKIVDILNLMEK